MAALINPKHEMMALAYAAGATQHEAYLQAGYAGAQPAAARIFKGGAIKARVMEIRAEREELARAARAKAAEEGSVTREWIIRLLKHNTLAAMRGVPVYDRKGQPTGNYKPDHSAAAKSLELLGRAEGIFIDRTEIGNPGDFTRHTDSELDAEILKTARELGLPEQGVKLLEDLTKRETAE